MDNNISLPLRFLLIDPIPHAQFAAALRTPLIPNINALLSFRTPKIAVFAA